jgi:hypothetical protein
MRARVSDQRCGPIGQWREGAWAVRELGRAVDRCGPRVGCCIFLFFFPSFPNPNVQAKFKCFEFQISNVQHNPNVTINTTIYHNSLFNFLPIIQLWEEYFTCFEIFFSFFQL